LNFIGSASVLRESVQRRKMAVTSMDASIADLAKKTEHRKLAIWAADCSERVLHYFEGKYPEDDRPRKAIEALRAWILTGVFKMAIIRQASLSAHAAAREVAEDDVARSAARAAGQAVATAHVPTHAVGAAIYAATAVRDASTPSDAYAAMLKERRWQYQHLLHVQEACESKVREATGTRS
jgi:hypothetical protein